MKTKLMVSYTYLTEGGNRRHETSVIERPDDLTEADAAYWFVRHNISSEGVVLGFWRVRTPTVDFVHVEEGSVENGVQYWTEAPRREGE